MNNYLLQSNLAWLLLSIIFATSTNAQNTIPDSPYEFPKEWKTVVSLVGDTAYSAPGFSADGTIGSDANSVYRTALVFGLDELPEQADITGASILFNPGTTNTSYSAKMTFVGNYGSDLEERYDNIDDGELLITNMTYTNSFTKYQSTDLLQYVTDVFEGDTATTNGVNQSNIEFYAGFVSNNENDNNSSATIEVFLSVDYVVPVTFTNTDEGGNNLSVNSTLTVEGAVINSGDTKKIEGGKEITAKTNHEIFTSGSVNLKHNRWNENETKYKLNQTEKIDNKLKFNQAARFKPIHPATVQTRLFDTNTGDVIPVEIQDPWYVDGSGNQTEPWLTYPSGFTSATMPNGGIFLDQEFIPSNPSSPYYSIRVDPNYTDTNGIEFAFQGWETSNASISDPFNLVSGKYQTPVVFEATGAEITASYKAYKATNSADAMGTDQRRKIVEDIQHNKVYRVYESGGQLWYQWRDRNTNTWSYEKRIKTPADGLYDVQNPSIGVSDGRLWVVYEYYDGSITWLAVTKIVNPSASTPGMKDQNIEFFMGQNSIEEVSTSGIQYTSQPYESYSRGAIFVAA